MDPVGAAPVGVSSIIFVTRGATGSLVRLANEKSNVCSLSFGANFTHIFSFSGSFGLAILASSAVRTPPARSGKLATSLSAESSTATRPEKPFAGIGCVKSL